MIHLPGPQSLKIYHIAHVDRLPSILQSGGLYSDAQVLAQELIGTTIGMSNIKQRRLTELTLSSHPSLYVGECVPFYFSPRSVMLYMIYAKNSNLGYQGGQDEIIHLELDFNQAISWANSQGKRWAFTSSNAGSRYFQDYNDLSQLKNLNWSAINANNWSSMREEKQAEFLLEEFVSFGLVQGIGVHSQKIENKVNAYLVSTPYQPIVQVMPSWYY